VTGKVVKIDYANYVGLHSRPILVKFTDEREAWYSADELTVL
jgi:hypothetical protein